MIHPHGVASRRCGASVGYTLPGRSVLQDGSSDSGKTKIMGSSDSTREQDAEGITNARRSQNRCSPFWITTYSVSHLLYPRQTGAEGRHDGISYGTHVGAELVQHFKRPRIHQHSGELDYLGGSKPSHKKRRTWLKQ